MVATDIEGDIWVGGSGGSEARRLTSGPAFDSCAAVSPSGQQVAFCRNPSPDDTEVYELWVMDTDGANARQLTHLDGGAFSPSFSSSLHQVAFSFTEDFAEATPADILTNPNRWNGGSQPHSVSGLA